MKKIICNYVRAFFRQFLPFATLGISAVLLVAPIFFVNLLNL